MMKVPFSRHERHVAHVDVLLLDIEDGAGLGLGVDLEHDQAQRDLHRRGVGDPALAALGGVVLGVLELVVDEVELGGAGEVADREHRAQRLLEARDVAGRLVGAQELLVAFALDLDQVRHLHDFVDVAEDLADALLLAARSVAPTDVPVASELLRHGGVCLLLLSRTALGRRESVAGGRRPRDAKSAAGNAGLFPDRTAACDRLTESPASFRGRPPRRPALLEAL